MYAIILYIMLPGNLWEYMFLGGLLEEVGLGFSFLGGVLKLPPQQKTCESN